MNLLTTTKLSSKGQVVIPESVRDQLRLTEGTQFAVVWQNDVVILKIIHAPAMSDFDALIAQARKQARKAKLRKKDVEVMIEKIKRS